MVTHTGWITILKHIFTNQFMRKLLQLTVISTMLGVTALTAQSQVAAPVAAVRPIELGIDAGIGFRLNDPNYTIIGIPAQSLRMGFYISDNMSIEPAISLNVVSGSGSTITTYSGSLGVLRHFVSNRGIGSGIYVRPFVGFSGVSGLGTSDAQANIGFGFGSKIPFANRLATRLETNFQHIFASGENDDGNVLGVSIGVSFFTR